MFCGGVFAAVVELDDDVHDPELERLFARGVL